MLWRKMREPVTPKEWQDAVDSAAFALLVDSARRYGLIEGGPKINLERCIDILARGEILAYLPAPYEGLVTRFIHER